MKVVILAGGFGTRISEESSSKPKPMIEIGGKPILWHIMKYFSLYGYNEFVICVGYKGYVIKEYFANYHLHQSDYRVNTMNGNIELFNQGDENWIVDIIDTGLQTMTGGRLKRVKEYVGDNFIMTYGDGLSDVCLKSLVKRHFDSGLQATVTAVRPPGRFGALDMDSDRVTHFTEKPSGDGSFINGGFFVLNKTVLDLVDGDDCIWEKGPLKKLTDSGNLGYYKHDGFWQPMDTLREKNILESLIEKERAPWILWK